MLCEANIFVEICISSSYGHQGHCLMHKQTHIYIFFCYCCGTEKKSFTYVTICYTEKNEFLSDGWNNFLYKEINMKRMNLIKGRSPLLCTNRTEGRNEKRQKILDIYFAVPVCHQGPIPPLCWDYWRETYSYYNKTTKKCTFMDYKHLNPLVMSHIGFQTQTHNLHTL